MDAQLPGEIYEYVRDLLPPQAPRRPQGGRRAIDSVVVLRVIWFVLTVGCRWKDVPVEFNCSGETARTRLREWERAGVWQRLHRRLLRELNRRGLLETETAVVDSAQVRAFGGGDRSGPSPTDRRKKGTKYTLLVDGNGTPLAMQSAPANMSDHRQLLSTVAKFPQITGRRGRPRSMPTAVFADAGYDSDSARAILSLLNVTPLIRRKKTPHGSRLGQVRWVVERSFSWLFGLRRMRIRYDRTATIINAWMNLSLAAVCFQVLTRSIT
jgi:transposase